jgi:hypothetical protein
MHLVEKKQEARQRKGNLRAEEPKKRGSIPRKGKNYFYFPNVLAGYAMGCYPQVERPEPEADHTRPSSPRVKNLRTNPHA